MQFDKNISLSDIAAVLSLVAVCISLVAVARSNVRLEKSLKLSTLQAMITEMNNLRQVRAENPNLERSLFESRKEWSDLEIQHNITAVQLANIFEWAYIARRDGLLEKDVWDSWVQTWRSVILSSEPLRNAFKDSVWTFGRSTEISHELTKLVNSSGEIDDPHKPRSGLWQKLTGV